MNAQVNEVVVAPVKIPALNTKDFGMATHRHREFDADVPAGVTVEDIEKPDLWVNIARQLSIGDEVRIIPEDQAFYAKALVIHAVGSQVLMKVISSKVFCKEETRATPASPFFVDLRGKKKWCVIERSTGKVIKDMIQNEAMAHQELSDYMRALSN